MFFGAITNPLKQIKKHFFATFVEIGLEIEFINVVMKLIYIF